MWGHSSKSLLGPHLYAHVQLWKVETACQTEKKQTVNDKKSTVLCVTYWNVAHHQPPKLRPISMVFLQPNSFWNLNICKSALFSSQNTKERCGRRIAQTISWKISTFCRLGRCPTHKPMNDVSFFGEARKHKKIPWWIFADYDEFIFHHADRVSFSCPLNKFCQLESLQQGCILSSVLQTFRCLLLFLRPAKH